MALIQWKQIDPQLRADGQLTGSLEISGSLVLNGAQFTGGGGSNQTLSLNGYELSISQGNTVTLPSSSAADTGSLITSASATDNIITFVKGDGSTFNITIDTGSAGGSTDISALNAFTSSIQSEVDSLTAATSSYITSADQLTGSLDTRYALSGSVGEGSTDITSLNAFTASYFIDSASFDSRITDLAITGSVIAPIAIGSIGFDQYGNYSVNYGTGCSITATSTGDYSVTLDTAQPNAEYAIMFNAAGYTDLTEIEITNQTTTGFDINGYDSQGNPRGQRIDFVVYGKDPLQSVRVSVSGSGGATDISALNAFTSSIQAEVDSLTAATSSYLTSLPSGVISGSDQLTGSLDNRYALIGSGGSADVSYNGDRVVSNTLLGDLYSNNFNPGTTGSIQDFLTAVFFPNTAPTFTNSSYFTIDEFIANGSSAGILTATDSENQSLTFAISPSYTANFVSVASNGTITLNRIPTVEDFNTDNRGDGTLAHPVQVQVTDTFNSTTTDTIYINVTANSAPVFRQTSAVGSIITSYTVNRNENASAGEVNRIYFTDVNGDNITITSGSDVNGHFSLVKYSNYVQINQTTSSLDYASVNTYNMSITASDEHYQAGQDNDAIVTIPITINVGDNQAPVVNNQTFIAISENSNAGDTAGTVTASDNEGDTLTFTNFTLTNLKLDSNTINIGTYGGTSLSDPHEDPFQMNSSGVVTRKAGVYINSDLINNYWYQVQVKDAYNTLSAPATIVIPISDDPAPSISTNGTFYIIESATIGNTVKTNSNGYSGTQARVTSNQAVTWTTTSNEIQINGSGYISLSANVSGSYSSGQTFTADITASNSFGTTTETTLTFYVTANLAPSIAITDLGLDTDTAISGSTIATIAISDQENDTPYNVVLTATGGTDINNFNIVSQNSASSSLHIQPTTALQAGDYNLTVTATDTFGKVGTSSITLTVTTAADYGKFYIYTSTRTASGTLNASNYNNLMGIAGTNSDTPPEITSLTADTSSPIYKFKTGELGNASITVGGGVLTRRALTSGSSPSSVLINLGTFDGDGTVAEQIIFVYPSGSDMSGVPTTIVESFGGSDSGDYVLNINDAGSFANTISGAKLNSLTLDTPYEGYSEWFILGRTGTNTASTYEARLTAESGSAPS